jgi:hypothetical protein
MDSKDFMIREIKRHTDKDGKHYHSCRVKGGTAKLEDAPFGNVLGMYRTVCLTGKKKKEVKKEEQFKFNF